LSMSRRRELLVRSVLMSPVACPAGYYFRI
jgi:hypothetical protein